MWDRVGVQWRSTPLHWAAERGHVKCVTLLLQYGADVTATDHALGRTALHDAAHRGHVDCVAALLQSDALNVDARTKLGRTPLLLVRLARG